MPPEQDRATITGDLHDKFRADRPSGSRDMLADRHTDRETERKTDRSTPLPYRGGVKSVSAYVVRPKDNLVLHVWEFSFTAYCDGKVSQYATNDSITYISILVAVVAVAVADRCGMREGELASNSTHVEIHSRLLRVVLTRENW